MESRELQEAARQGLKTPAFVVDERLLERNLLVLSGVKGRAGCRILLALKAFAMYSTFPLVRKYLDGVCASGLWEAMLGAEKFGKEVHTFSPAYAEGEMAGIVANSHTVTFNSLAQLKKYGPLVKKAGREVGLRVNPGFSDNPHPMYNPCAPAAGLGVPSSQLDSAGLSGVDGLHFHVLCEQGADSLEKVLAHFERRFAKAIPKVKWVNFGGGHWITKPGYDVDLLVDLVRGFRERHGVDVYLEPGEAVAIHTGVLVATVLDVDTKGAPVAVLDVSAAAHMPDTLEMPYTPEIRGARIVPNGKRPPKGHVYTLRGNTCLAGDRIGQGRYAFKKALKVGDRLILEDMAHYTMVKTSTFNGVCLPSIARITLKGELKVERTFGYEDFKGRLS